MSQFQNNFGFNPDQALSGLAGFNSPFSQPQNRRGRRPMQAQVHMTQPTGGFAQAGYHKYMGGGAAGYMQGSPGLANRPSGGFSTGIPQQTLRWDTSLAQAMGQDMSQQQSAMNQMFSQLGGQSQQAEREFLGGMDAFRRQSEQQYQNMQGIAGGVEAAGRETLNRATQFGQDVLGDVRSRVDRADQQAAAGVSEAERMVSDFRDTSAQDAANLAFGMRRNVESTLRQIESNPDMTPAERQAARMELSQQTESQVTQGVTGIFSNMNQQMASLRGQLSQVRMAQAATTQQGAGLIGQVGTQVGAQRLEAENMNLRMQELGSSIRVTAEQSAAAAQMQATMAMLQGRETIYNMIQGNPMQFVSQFAGLTGYLAAASTPGLNRISIPNFG